MLLGTTTWRARIWTFPARHGHNRQQQRSQYLLHNHKIGSEPIHSLLWPISLFG